MQQEKIISVKKLRQEKPTVNGNKLIIKNFNLSVEEGEFVCILGPTGCGKTTLMRIIAGIDPYTKGEVEVLSKKVMKKGRPSWFRQIGTAFQTDNLLEFRTVYQNVSLPLENFGMKPKRTDDERIMAMLELTGLAGYRDCYPRELSGGGYEAAVCVCTDTGA